MATEKRLIDANAVDYENIMCSLSQLRWLNAIIEAQPTVDAVEVVHGRWEKVLGVLTPGGDPLLRCPICKSRESEHLCGIECRTVWNYCPNCGALMDGDVNA